MEQQTVSRDLLVGSVLQQILHDNSKLNATPKQAKNTLDFANTAFFYLYGDHWEDYISLRHEVNRTFGNPKALKLVDDALVFDIVSTINFSYEVMTIARTYLKECGWTVDSIERTGKFWCITAQGTDVNYIYTFKLTPKEKLGE